MVVRGFVNVKIPIIQQQKWMLVGGSKDHLDYHKEIRKVYVFFHG